MRYLLVGIALAHGLLTAQAPATGLQLSHALEGNWTGTLENRDYAEAAGSEKRVKLPTWLKVTPVAGDLRFEYIYDDGPEKVVREVSTVRIDTAGAAYSVMGSDGKVEDRYAVAGLGDLKEGRGTLTLTGPGTENKLPVNVRTTMRIRRNLLEILRETGAAGEPLHFRHLYTFVRAAAPAK